MSNETKQVEVDISDPRVAWNVVNSALAQWMLEKQKIRLQMDERNWTPTRVNAAMVDMIGICLRNQEALMASMACILHSMGMEAERREAAEKSRVIRPPFAGVRR